MKLMRLTRQKKLGVDIGYCTAERLEEKFGWLREYRQEIARWSEWQTISGGAIDVVRRFGYGSGAASQVAESTRAAVCTEAGEELQSELVSYVADQSSRARRLGRVPGSTEILESSVGKWKSLEGDHQKGGFTHLLLSYAALLGTTTTELIGEAMRATTWKQVARHHHAIPTPHLPAQQISEGLQLQATPRFQDARLGLP